MTASLISTAWQTPTTWRMEVVQGLAQFPERGSYPKELVALGIKDYRQTTFKPYRVIYRLMGSQVVIYLIVNGRRDMQSVLARRLLCALSTRSARVRAIAHGYSEQCLWPTSTRHQSRQQVAPSPPVFGDGRRGPDVTWSRARRHASVPRPPAIVPVPGRRARVAIRRPDFGYRTARRRPEAEKPEDGHTRTPSKLWASCARSSKLAGIPGRFPTPDPVTVRRRGPTTADRICKPPRASVTRVSGDRSRSAAPSGQRRFSFPRPATQHCPTGRRQRAARKNPGKPPGGANGPCRT